MKSEEHNQTKPDIKTASPDAVTDPIAEKRNAKNTLPKLVEEDGPANVLVQLKDADQLERLFGCEHPEFAEAMTIGCINVSGADETRTRDRSDALAIVAEIAPKDGIEAMLATQMAAIHLATMRHSARLASASHLQQVEVQERVLNKLARTFTAQMEALRKHRHGGQQKMTVEHVTVNEGGQAIVGNVSKGDVQK